MHLIFCGAESSSGSKKMQKSIIEGSNVNDVYHYFGRMFSELFNFLGGTHIRKLQVDRKVGSLEIHEKTSGFFHLAWDSVQSVFKPWL